MTKLLQMPSHPWSGPGPAREHMLESQKEIEIIRLAGLIGNQEMLDKILGDVPAGEMRDAVFAKIRPHLRFVPEGLDQDCPKCGRHNGKVIPHECLAN